MSIDEKTLLEERKVLETDFNTMSDRIKQVEKDLGIMKSNLNALYGAIQQTDKLLVKSTSEAQYWNGVRLISQSNPEDNISISSKVIN